MPTTQGHRWTFANLQEPLHLPFQSCSLPWLGSDHLPTLRCSQPRRTPPNTRLSLTSWSGFCFLIRLVRPSSPLGSLCKFIPYRVCIGIPMAWVHFPKCTFTFPHIPLSVRRQWYPLSSFCGLFLCLFIHCGLQKSISTVFITFW